MNGFDMGEGNDLNAEPNLPSINVSFPGLLRMSALGRKLPLATGSASET